MVAQYTFLVSCSFYYTTYIGIKHPGRMARCTCAHDSWSMLATQVTGFAKYYIIFEKEETR